MVPLVVLAGCSTASGADRAGAEQLPGLARGLLAHGVPAVLAMTATVTDPYATDLVSRLYHRLADAGVPDTLAAFTEARRLIEIQRQRLPAGDRAAALVEWATPKLFARAEPAPLYDPTTPFEQIREPAAPTLGAGIVVRAVGDFVGRRSELRLLLRVLRGPAPHVLLHGIGDAGKSTLAAELVHGLGQDAGLVVSLHATTAVEQILDETGQCLLAIVDDRSDAQADPIRHLAAKLRTAQVPWADRLRLLRAKLLPSLPVLLLLDNIEDNLAESTENGQPAWTVADPDLGEFLAAWIRLGASAKLLTTSRHPFLLPDHTERRLTAHHLVVCLSFEQLFA
jgi:hypothetical protein